MRALTAGGLVLAALTGCLTASPEDEARDRLGVGAACEALGEDAGPEHCAGRPCLTCHAEDYHPDTEAFLLAGTVYDHADDVAGREGVTVSFVDADLRPFTVRSNRTGNFMVSVDEGAPASEEVPGWARIGFRPRFPLSVGVITSELGRNMRSYVWREGDCAACHEGAKSARSNGPIYVRVRE